MKIALCLYHYFPFGGLQKDFLRVANGCVAAGHAVRVYVMSWQGEHPAGIDIQILTKKGRRAITANQNFSDAVAKALTSEPAEVVIGFNKMPGLDYYFAADGCFAMKAELERSWWYKLTPRYKHFSEFESAVFSAQSKTKIFLIAPAQREQFQHYYATPDDRMQLLPPGIEHEFIDEAQHLITREAFRHQHNLHQDEIALLHVGSGFDTKGVDRTINAMAAVIDKSNIRMRLFVVGQGDTGKLLSLAARLGQQNNVEFVGGRDDVARFMHGCDVLTHPARKEAGGLVLLEALLAGLPVITTDVCGHAHHIESAASGVVLSSPFDVNEYQRNLLSLVQQDRHQLREKAMAYCNTTDLHNLVETVVHLIDKGGARR